MLGAISLISPQANRREPERTAGTAPSTLRHLLEDLDRTGELLHVSEEVDPEYEVSAICEATSRAGAPAVLFERVKGSSMPLVANVYATRSRIARALGCHESTLLEQAYERLQQGTLQLRDPEPAAEHLGRRTVLQGDDVDLGLLPIPLWNEGDGGPFVTGGIILAEGLDGPNAAIYRLQVHDARTLGMAVAADHHVRRLLERPGREEPVEVAVAIGVPPPLMIAAGSDFGVHESELEVAGRFLGEPVRLARSLTVSVPWPVEAEIVLEGVLDGEMRHEGPFVEFTGYQTDDGPRPVLRVTAMHYRPDALYQAAYVARPPNETSTIWRELEESVALGTLRERYPIVTAVHRPADIARDFFCVIQVDTRSAKPGMIRNLLAGAAYCLPRPKYVVVVDTDIDIYRLEDVLWAMCVRVHPQHDVTLIPDTFGSPIDPRGPTPPLTAKLLIDATTKADSVGTMSGPPDKARQRAAEILERAARA